MNYLLKNNKTLYIKVYKILLKNMILNYIDLIRYNFF